MGGDVNRTKLCPNCVKYVGDQDASCKHCGYKFDSGDVPATATWQVGETGAAGAGVPAVSVTGTGDQKGVTIQWQNPDGEQSTQTIDLSQQVQTAKRAGKIIALVVTLIVLASIAIPIWAVVKGVDSAVEGFSDFEVPGITVPSIEFTMPPIAAEEGTGSFAACRSTALKWLRELLANDGTGSRSLSTLFIEASEDVGAASDDYRVIVQAFSGSQGVALSKGTKAGLRAARPIVTSGCREAYP